MKMATAARINFRAAVVFGIALLAFILIGCTSTDDYRERAIALVAPHGFAQRTISAGPFQIFVFVKNQNLNAPWRIYIEGDGRAYVNYELSLDPTPSQNTVLDLLLTDPAPNILYMARPCQFVRTDSCDAKYWSNARYGEEVLHSLQSAIHQTAGDAPIELMGYSGGGTLAVLLATRMPQVTGVRTLAANLSVKEQTTYFNLTPLDQSFDPIDFVTRLRTIPQIHLIAGADTAVIPPETVAHYQNALSSSCAQFIILDGMMHQGPWQIAWKQWQSVPFQACANESLPTKGRDGQR
jgi:hypothetical protein